MRADIQPEKLYWASFNRFELRLPGQCVLDCSHSGPCDADVNRWVDRVRAQVAADNFALSPNAENISAELAEYGAWDEEQLADDEQNWHRLVWIAANNIAEETEPDCTPAIV